jgi:hypothetical protein
MFDKISELALFIPFLEDLSRVGFAGTLPHDLAGETSWRFNMEDKSGGRHSFEIHVDPTAKPWNLSVSLDSLAVPLEDITAFLPETWEIPPATGTCQIHKLKASGPMGHWKDWSVEARLTLDFDDLEVSQYEAQVSGLKLELDTKGKWSDWTGTASVIAKEVDTAAFPEPLLGLSARDLDVSVSLAKQSFSLSGPWAVDQAFGSAWSGIFACDSGGAWRLEGKTKALNPAAFKMDLEGTWQAAFKSEGDLKMETRPTLDLSLSSKAFRWGRYDLSSRPVTVHLTGNLPTGEKKEWDSAEISWGEGLHVGANHATWSGGRLDVRETTFTGDLVALSELFPQIKVNPRYGRWVNPRNWKIEGGISLTLAPSFAIRIEEGRIDSGKGIEGPIAFEYFGETGKWAFRSPTLRFDIRDLLEEMGLSQFDMQGVMQAKADLAGRIPPKGTDVGWTGWIQSGAITGKVEDCSGKIWSFEGSRDGNPPWFGWRGLNGTFEVQWSAASTRVSTALFAKQWIFYTRTVPTAREYPQELATPARLNLLLSRIPGEPYELKDLAIYLGDVSPIELSASGTIDKRENGWFPDLVVRGKADHADPTPVFRGVKLGGTGGLLGEVHGNELGNWVFQGNLDCNHVLFEELTVPVVLKDVRDRFYLEDIHLDELVSGKRWRSFRHVFPPDPDEEDSLAKAFDQSAQTRVNLRIGEALIGESRYADLDVRTIMIRDVLHMNTVEGKFAEGDYPFKMTGFVFFVPGVGSGWRVRGETDRVPLSVGVPGLFPRIGLAREALSVTFYISRTPPKDRIQTRFVTLGFPIGALKDIPGVGPLLFGWTPDTLGSQVMIVQKVGDGPWNVLNPFKLPDAPEIPRYFFQKLPKSILGQIGDKMTNFSRGAGEAIKEFIGGGQ